MKQFFTTAFALLLFLGASANGLTPVEQEGSPADAELIIHESDAWLLQGTEFYYDMSMQLVAEFPAGEDGLEQRLLTMDACNSMSLGDNTILFVDSEYPHAMTSL